MLAKMSSRMTLKSSIVNVTAVNDDSEAEEPPSPPWKHPPTAPSTLGFSDIDTRISLLQRFILDVLIFTYDVAVPTTSKMTHLLSPPERVTCFYLSHVVVFAICTVTQSKSSTFPISRATENILERNYNVLMTYVVQPAVKLGIAPEWVFEQLYAFFIHQCEKRKRIDTLPYHHSDVLKNIDGSCWRDHKRKNLLAKRIVADGVVVGKLLAKKLGSSGDVEDMIFDGIESFCHETLGDAEAIVEKVEPKMWFGQSARNLAVEMRKKRGR